MKARLLALPTLLLVGAVLTAEEPSPAEKELKQLEGTWVVETMIGGGKDFYADGQPKAVVVFKGDKARIEGNELLQKLYTSFTIKVDPTTNPKCMDMVITEGSMKGMVVECIYEVKGDELKMCARLGGNERPSKFESPEGTPIVLAVAKRQKP
jgi:uncharacterized protein (TIGR03067 family)